MIQKFTKILGLVALTGLSNLVEAQLKWSPAGPIYTAGRARNMVVDKTDASGKTLYVGSTSSGVFTSTNGGVNWVPIDDQGSVRNISYMAQAPDGTIYAATGEGFLRLGQKAKALPGTGLYKLTGKTLTQVVSAASVGTVINRVAVSPASSAVIALATNLGVFVSLDGGLSFSQPSGIVTATNIGGQDVKFDSNGNLFCSVGAEAGTSTLTPSKVYKSTSSALSSFIAITPTSSVLADLNYGRIELGIAPTNDNIIYASCANKNTDGKNSYTANLKGLFVSYDGGITWALIIQGSPQLDPLGNGGTIYSGDYAQCLYVSANDPHTLFFGGYSMYIWKRNVGSFGDSNTNPIGDWGKLGLNFATNSPLYLHENIHDIKVIGSNPSKYYFVTDAGIYRSTDIVSLTQTFPPSFQPFYKGLVTGQFNSVSIERFPVGENSTGAANGSKVGPYSGFIGGTGGNGVTYYSGTYSLVTQESSYLSGDVYNAEYSKILPNAAFATNGIGNMYRSSNMKSSNPIAYSVNKYTGAMSKLAPDPQTFVNFGVATGTPFKLWEFYGQNPTNPDNIYFYNDSLRFPASVSTIAELGSTRTWTLSNNRRPDRFATMDSIVIRTATVAVAQVSASPAFNTSKTITIKLNNNYVNTGSVTVLTAPQLTLTGDYGPEQATLTLNNSTLNDDIVVSFLTPPFGDKTVTATTPGHYRVFATVFYKYKAGDSINVSDNNISTKLNAYSSVFPTDHNWRYGTPPSYTVTAIPNSAVSNPTYNILPAGYSGTTTMFQSLPISVNVVGTKQFTIVQYGDYSMNAKTVDYTLAVNTDTNVSGTTYSFVLLPGNVVKTVSATPTPTAPIVFTVSPTANTVYTVTQSGTGTLTAVTNFTIGASSYVLNPGNITQSTPQFSITITPTTPVSAYTITGTSSNTLLAANTTTTFANYPIRSSSTVGSTIVPFSSRNQPVKMQMRQSARLAVAVTNNEISGGLDAVAVSKNPLALNDPGNFVRISQSGCMTDDANGNATTNTVVVDGRPTIIEWSKNGTELYYATDANKVYRVSHITDIMDLSPSSYNGKFYTDIFMYNTGTGNVPNNAFLNMSSPYRTTLIGTFDKPITSISVSNDDTKMVLTFNNPSQTGTTGIVMYSDASNIKTSNAVTWVKKDGGLNGLTTYCSMMEKGDNKMVFAGTDKGLFYTTDISAGAWVNVNNGLNDEDKIPNVQVFDVKQQVMMPWDCYNSGQIYVATNGRGVWSNSKFLKENYVGIDEAASSNKHTDALHIYPNPTNANVFVSYEGFDGQSLNISVLDLSGRIVRSEKIGQVDADGAYTMDASNLTAGVYFITLSSDGGMKKTGKLIVTK